MKLLRLQSVIVVLVCVLGISGCSPKKPVRTTVPQQPMTTAPEPTPTPEPSPTPQPAEAQPTQPAATPTDQAAKPKPKTTKHAVVKKTVPATTSPTDKPANTEVAKNNVTHVRVAPDKDPAPASNGGQISLAPASPDSVQTQASTDQLLQKAQENLNSLKRQLTKDEEAIRTQIKEFIDQSRKAVQDKDLLRAHNLALKARLLSDDLVAQR